jgi:hypothetical protein
MRALVIAALALAACGKDSKGDWEASRRHYCDEVDLMRHDAIVVLDAWSERLEDLPPEPERQIARCEDARQELRQLAARLEGFDRGASALVNGRGNDSVANAGLATEFGHMPILELVLRDMDCHAPPFPTHGKKVREAKARAMKELDDAVARCRSIGWTSGAPGVTP